MRLLLLSHNLRGEGTYLRLEGIGREMARRGHDVTLVVASAGESRRDAAGSIPYNLTIVEMASLFPSWLAGSGLDPLDMFQRLRWVGIQGFDVVHASDHRPAASWPALRARRVSGAIYVSDWADLWGSGGIMQERYAIERALIGPLETRYERHIHANADAVTAISSDLYSRALGIGQPPDRILLLPNGVDTNIFKPVLDRYAVRRVLGVPVEARLIGFAGQARIDMDLIWESFSMLRVWVPDAKLLLMGSHWGEVAEMESIKDHVIQMGWLPARQYAQALGCCDVMLLPYRNTSRNRGRWPGKMAFYMGVGRPTVGNPTGDIKPLLEERGVGLAVGEQPDEFARGILELLDDQNLADRLGRQARHVAETEFAWSVLAGSLEDFYHSVIALKGG